MPKASRSPNLVEPRGPLHLKSEVSHLNSPFLATVLVALLAGPLSADTVRVRMIAVVDTKPERTWTVEGETKPLPAHSRVLRPDSKTASVWKQPEPGTSGFAGVFADRFGTGLTGESRLSLVFEGLVSPRCDGPGIADGAKGAAHDGPSRAALVSQVLQAENFARELAPSSLPGFFRDQTRDPTAKRTFTWSGLVLLNGASEASGEKSSQDFAGNFSLTLADWRAELGKNVPILWAKLPPAPESWEEARRRRWNRVRDMQAELAAVQPLTKCLETDDLPVLPGTADLTPEGWTRLAERAAQTLAEITASQESCCPPSE